MANQISASIFLEVICFILTEWWLLQSQLCFYRCSTLEWQSNQTGLLIACAEMSPIFFVAFFFLFCEQHRRWDYACMQAMESKHKTVVLEPVIDLVFSLQSFSKFMRQNDVLYLFIYLIIVIFTLVFTWACTKKHNYWLINHRNNVLLPFFSFIQVSFFER